MRGILSKMLCRILPVPWDQPLLNSNGTVGVDEMAVAEGWTGGGIRPTWRPYGTAWWAFHTESGYTGGFATGFGDDGESANTYYLWIWVKKLINVTGVSFCFPGLDSDNDGWGAFRWFGVYASNDGNCWGNAGHGSWVGLYGEDGANSGYNGNVCPRGGSTTKSFQNPNFYNYYMLVCGTNGGGHRDGLTICSVRLIAEYEDFI